MKYIAPRALAFCLLSTLLTVSSVVLAQYPKPAPPPKLTTTENGPITLVFEDGREAEARKTIVGGAPFRTSFEVYQSTCGKIQRAKCEYTFRVESHRFYFVWTKHPDAAKLGAEMRSKFSGGLSSSFDDYVTASTLTKHAVPSLAKDVEDQLITCQSYAFLGREVPLGGTLDVDLWSVERASFNTETNQAENRSDMSFNGLKFEMTGEGLRLRDFENSQGILSLPYLFLDDSASMTLTKEDGDVCQVGMKGSISGGKPVGTPTPDRAGLPVIYDADTAKLPSYGGLSLWDQIRSRLSYGGEAE